MTNDNRAAVTRRHGRPSKKTEEVILHIERAQNLGFNISTCCKLVGISRETYYRWLSEDPEFRDRVKGAEASGAKHVAAKLRESIDSGNVTAMIFWLKTRTEEFRENKDMDRLARNMAASMLRSLLDEIEERPVPDSVMALLEKLEEVHPRRVRIRLT